MATSTRASAKVLEIVKESREKKIVLQRKGVDFVPAALRDFKAMGKGVTALVGMELELLSLGETPTSFKPVPQIGPGTYEIRAQTAGKWIRVFYVAIFEDAIWVVDAIAKTQNKIEQVDIERAQDRYKVAAKKSAEKVAAMKAFKQAAEKLNVKAKQPAEKRDGLAKKGK